MFPEPPRNAVAHRTAYTGMFSTGTLPQTIVSHTYPLFGRSRPVPLNGSLDALDLSP